MSGRDRSTGYSFFASATIVDEAADITNGSDLLGVLFMRDSKAFTEAVLYGVFTMMSLGQLPLESTASMRRDEPATTIAAEEEERM
ncbi:hypothetical protein QJS04_geneDACA005240 [Acorus gramineus]|uniref:Uncharacterized protein n=1 Tax=Acorus gramineus TaxID=55184 RepID=A0AAV9AWE8_ACOGR|nr:hypothetical protein QJS04_geneDACA005240 [Acorus gramineus]